MTTRRLSLIAAVILAFAAAPHALFGATDAVRVQVERSLDKAYLVDGTFDVEATPELVWEVLTDYEGIGGFVSSIRHSTVRRREEGGVLLEQHGVGKAWIVSVPMHVVLAVREHGRRILLFRDVCGKSFSVYEGKWELLPIDGGTRVTYHLKADPTGRQPAMLARPAMGGSVKKLLQEVRSEMIARTAR